MGMGTCIELSFRRVPKTTKKQNNLKKYEFNIKDQFLPSSST